LEELLELINPAAMPVRLEKAKPCPAPKACDSIVFARLINNEYIVTKNSGNKSGAECQPKHSEEGKIFASGSPSLRRLPQAARYAGGL
jgi:hypothetical protein